MTSTYSEKYLSINREFPAMKGAIEQQLSAQKRLLEKLLKEKKSDEVKELMYSVTMSIDETEKLLAWMHKILVGVGEDAKALIEGSKVRTDLAFTTQLAGELLTAQQKADDERIKEFTRKG